MLFWVIFLKTVKVTNLKKLLSNPIVNGTLILTFAGGASRFIGFFYRIFLTRTIGAEGLGIYQLICPVLALSYALCCAGFQTAISKLVAEARDNGRKCLAAGIFLSLIVTIIFEAIIYLYADQIAIKIICEPRCTDLLRILSFSFIPATIHSCINGCYYGLKKTVVPALSQLVEQLARVGSVYLIYVVKQSSGSPLTPADVVWGITICEICGLLFSVSAMHFTNQSPIALNTYKPNNALNLYDRRKAHKFPKHLINKGSRTFINYTRELCALAVPMSLNHVLLTLCTAFENILIPIQLQKYGCTTTDSLSVFGILSGVAMPVLLFPCVLTNSVCVMLLPDISEAQSQNNAAHIRNTTRRAMFYGAVFGLLFTSIFRFGGNFIGNEIFNSGLASHYILRLCWLCPFMYVTSLLSSILHGLGKPKSVLVTNILAGGIRIFMIIFAVPVYGIDAYLWSMLVAQIFATVAFVYLTNK